MWHTEKRSSTGEVQKPLSLPITDYPLFASPCTTGCTVYNVALAFGNAGFQIFLSHSRMAAHRCIHYSSLKRQFMWLYCFEKKEKILFQRLHKHIIIIMSSYIIRGLPDSEGQIMLLFQNYASIICQDEVYGSVCLCVCV